MESDAIKKIVELTNERFDNVLFDHEGKKWSTKSFHPVIFDPSPDEILLFSLSGVVDYVTENPDKIDYEKDKTFINVLSPYEIVFSSGLNEYFNRKKYLRAESGFESFKFGYFIKREEFLINLKTLFINTPDNENLQKYISRISQNSSSTISDDGVSQSVTLSKGMSGAVVENVKISPIQKLKPIRYFTELDQIESEFVFRMKEDKISGEPVCALFDCDGGMWKNIAIARIKNYLQNNINIDIPIIA